MSDAGDPLITLAQYGLLGLILVMLLTGWLWAKPAVDDMKRTFDATLKQHELERRLWEDRLLPSMERLTRALEDNTREGRVAVNEMAEVIRLLEDRRP